MPEKRRAESRTKSHRESSEVLDRSCILRLGATCTGLSDTAAVRSMFEPAELAFLADVKEAEDAHVYGEEIQLEEVPKCPSSEEAEKLGHVMGSEASLKYGMNERVARVVKGENDAHENDSDDILDGRFEDGRQDNQRVNGDGRVFHGDGEQSHREINSAENP